MKNNVLFILFVVFLLHAGTKCFSQISNTDHPAQITGRIIDLFKEQLEVYPQEKIHLHTDRDVYVPGEKIWFKAYVVDAVSHLYPTLSRYVYIELISPADTLIHRVMIRQDDGMFFGNLSLTEYIPAGDYTLRAYTRYMENMGDDYFFKKNIRIENIAAERGNEGSRESRGNSGSSGIRNNRTNLENPANRGLDYDVSFFPEGGNLPEGVLSKIAFKALNKNGYPETVSGLLVDETGAEITSVQTFYAGMGVFEYLPEAGKKYRLKCTNENGFQQQFELPQPNLRAYSLAVDQSNNKLSIKINRSAQAPDIPCYLLVHCRGERLYFSEWDINE
jgi:hypothetical protein